MTFKHKIATTLTTLLLCTGVVANVCGQTAVTVTGHITAEVIESVHASSTMVTGFALKNDQIKTGSLQNDGANWDSETVNLGAVTINAGESMACNIILKEAKLSDSKGNYFTINPSLAASGPTNTLLSDGSHTVNLNGTARLTHGLASGKYQGSYTLDVLYN